MRTYLLHIASLGLLLAASGQTVPDHAQITARAEEHRRGVEPTQKGQIGVNLPPPESFSGSIGPHSAYLEHHGEDNDLQWKGDDPNHITIFEATKTIDGKPTVTTVTQDVKIAVNEVGNFDIVISPFFREKLEAIAKEVKPCAAGKARRAARRPALVFRRQGPTSFCGSLDFANRLSTDSGVGDVSAQLDQGLHNAWEDGNDSGYESMSEVDEDGFWQATAEGGEGGEGSILENLIISSEEDAAVVAGAAADGVAADAILAGSTIITGSFLAMIWSSYLKSGKVDFAYKVPKESVHKITKTKTENTQTTTTSSDSCPTVTDAFPTCGDGCMPTKVTGASAQPTKGSGWACSEGDNKDCGCSPREFEVTHPYDEEMQKMIWEALDEVQNAPEEMDEDCDGNYSDVPSVWVSDIVKNFCHDAMESKDGISDAANAYNIYGNRIPITKAKAMDLTASTSNNRSPPVSMLQQENYEDFRFFLHYLKHDGECVVDKADACNKAFAQMKEKRCGQSSGTNGNFMTVEASADIGCAELGWKIEKAPGADPVPVPTLKDRVCHDAKDKHDVHDGPQETWSRYGCLTKKDEIMRADSQEIWWGVPGMAGDWYQNYRISWIKDCDQATEQRIDKPIPDSDVTCEDIMRKLYTQCDNKGSGGTQEAGCLLYDFWKAD